MVDASTIEVNPLRLLTAAVVYSKLFMFTVNFSCKNARSAAHELQKCVLNQIYYESGSKKDTSNRSKNPMNCCKVPRSLNQYNVDFFRCSLI